VLILFPWNVSVAKGLYLHVRMLTLPAVSVLDPRQLVSTCTACWQFGDLEALTADADQCRADSTDLQGRWTA
jgi:hypothetical protein